MCIGFCVVRPMAVAAGLSLALAGSASASISGITSTDNSSGGVFQTFLHQTSVSPVTTAGNTAEFTHTTQLLNAATYSGGAAQINVGNSSFQLAFTVEDPTNAGFTVDVDQLLQGYSAVSVTTGRGDATGVSYFVQFDDSTDAPGTLSNRVDLFIGTGGVTETVDAGMAPASTRQFDSATDSDVLGAYVGTTDFLLDYTTFFSPTTNVFFQNNSIGNGEVSYGLGTAQPGDNFAPEDLGHFLTVRATFVPEPTSAAAVAALGLLGLRRRR